MISLWCLAWSVQCYTSLVAVEGSGVPTECWLLSAYVHLRLHHYQSADRAARRGQRSMMIVTETLLTTCHAYFNPQCRNHGYPQIS